MHDVWRMLTCSVLNSALSFSPLRFYFTHPQDKCYRISSDPKLHVPSLTGYTWGIHLIKHTCWKTLCWKSPSTTVRVGIEVCPGPQVCTPPTSRDLAKRQMPPITSIPTSCWVCIKLAVLIIFLPVLRVLQIHLNYCSLHGEGVGRLTQLESSDS